MGKWRLEWSLRGPFSWKFPHKPPGTTFSVPFPYNINYQMAPKKWRLSFSLLKMGQKPPQGATRDHFSENPSFFRTESTSKNAIFLGKIEGRFGRGPSRRPFLGPRNAIFPRFLKRGFRQSRLAKASARRGDMPQKRSVMGVQRAKFAYGVVAASAVSTVSFQFLPKYIAHMIQV